MKRTICRILLCAIAVAVLSSTAPAAEATDDEKLAALVKEVQAQQTQIAENQAKIDAKMAEVADAIRVARIFSGRER
jgi:uncharacterized membrane protein (DUF106 family)